MTYKQKKNFGGAAKADGSGKNLERKQCRIGLVIRDCDQKTIQKFEFGMKEDCFAFPLFCCPLEDDNNGVGTFVNNLKEYLDLMTPIDGSKGVSSVKWWQKIEKFGLFLPRRVVKMYHTKNRE